MFLRHRWPLALSLCLGVCACGRSIGPSKTATSTQPAPPRTEAVAPPAPATSLRRADVKDAIAQGVGAFLQNVAVEDWPVMRGGKFHGFKLRALNPEWNIALRPGDVVTRVNGIVPERPEHADAVLRSLEKAKSLKVDFERDGKEASFELPIVD